MIEDASPHAASTTYMIAGSLTDIAGGLAILSFTETEKYVQTGILFLYSHKYF
jgi:hypothetical protein